MLTHDRNIKIEEYLRKVRTKIRNKTVHPRISQEIENHITDAQEALMSQGLDEATALKKAIAEMGNAGMLGRQLNKAHRPNPTYGMRPSLSIKTMLRTPIKTAMAFLLIAAASFALFSRVTDYAITSREMNTAVGYYRGVAALDNSQPPSWVEVGGSATTGFAIGNASPETPPWPSDEQIEEFSLLPGVTLADKRYMTAGRIDGLKRMFSGYDYATFVVEGTFAGCGINPMDAGLLEYNLTDINLLAGDFSPEPKETFTIRAFSDDTIGGMLENLYGQTFADSLSEGCRLLVIGTYSSTDPGTAFLFGGMGYLSNLHIIDGLPENYLETEEFAHVSEIIEVANNDRQVFDIVYTKDMRAILQFNEHEMIIMQGRELTGADTNACVVSQDFIFSNNLGLGDKLTIELGDRLFSQSGMGAQSLYPDMRSDFIETAELEIVGVYRFLDSFSNRPGWVYTRNAIFAPASLLPVIPPTEHELTPGEFSVLIENVYDIDRFLERATPMAEELNINMHFSDRGWSSMKEVINSSQRATLLTTVLYICVALLALLLAVYLYIGQKKKDFAIMRALGTTIGKSRNALTLPLFILSAFAVPVGGYAGLSYTSQTVVSALEGLEGIDGYVMDASLSIIAIILCLICQVAFMALCAMVFLNKIGKTSPLALLQGDVIKVRDVEIAASVEVKATGQAVTAFNTRTTSEADAAPKVGLIPVITRSSKATPRGHYFAFSHVLRYIFRHMRRVGWKTAIPLTLAIALIGALGLLAITRQSYEDAYNEVNVKCRLTNFSSASVSALSRSELVENLQSSGSFPVLINGTDHMANMRSTNDLEHQISVMMAGDYSIEFAEGFSDTSFFATDSPYVVLGSGAACTLGVKPGDNVSLLAERIFTALNEMIENKEELQEILSSRSTTCKVAGVIHSESLVLSELVFSPLGRTAEAINRQPFPVEYGEFILSDNERLHELVSLLEWQTTSSLRYSSGVTFFVDTMELENIMRVRDLIVLLFPVAVLGAVLIGLTAPGLLILQSSKEAAILRILGTTKKRVRCMLFFEQLILCVAGVLFAIGGLVIYNSGLFARNSQTLALCVMLYLSGCISAGLAASVSVTRRKVLALLQVSE